MEMAFESTKLPEEKKVKMVVSFLDDSAHHWWTLARRNNDGAQTMTWKQFKALFLENGRLKVATIQAALKDVYAFVDPHYFADYCKKCYTDNLIR
ncbi:hypothetical protein ACLB2K_007805 [Fragaria x ananassa]